MSIHQVPLKLNNITHDSFVQAHELNQNDQALHRPCSKHIFEQLTDFLGYR